MIKITLYAIWRLLIWWILNAQRSQIHSSVQRSTSFKYVQASFHGNPIKRLVTKWKVMNYFPSSLPDITKESMSHLDPPHYAGGTSAHHIFKRWTGLFSAAEGCVRPVRLNQILNWTKMLDPAIIKTSLVPNGHLISNLKLNIIPHLCFTFWLIHNFLAWTICL